jgi:hypothetical protein
LGAASHHLWRIGCAWAGARCIAALLTSRVCSLAMTSTLNNLGQPASAYARKLSGRSNRPSDLQSTAA